METIYIILITVLITLIIVFTTNAIVNYIKKLNGRYAYFNGRFDVVHKWKDLFNIRLKSIKRRLNQLEQRANGFKFNDRMFDNRTDGMNSRLGILETRQKEYDTSLFAHAEIIEDLRKKKK